MRARDPVIEQEVHKKPSRKSYGRAEATGGAPFRCCDRSNKLVLFPHDSTVFAALNCVDVADPSCQSPTAVIGFSAVQDCDVPDSSEFARSSTPLRTKRPGRTGVSAKPNSCIYRLVYGARRCVANTPIITMQSFEVLAFVFATAFASVAVWAARKLLSTPFHNLPGPPSTSFLQGTMRPVLRFIHSSFDADISGNRQFPSLDGSPRI